MVTISPRFLNAEPMISVADTSMSSDSSEMVRNSVTRTVFASRSASSWASISASSCSSALGRELRRRRFFPPPPFSSAITRWMFSCTASWSGRWRFLPFFLSRLRRPSLV